MPGARRRMPLATIAVVVSLLLPLLPGCHLRAPGGGRGDDRPCPRALTSDAPPCAVDVPVDLPPGASVPPPHRNLVFQGGGVKGVAHAGALLVLEQRGLLAPVERVAGTSVGAMYALLVSLGYSATEILDVTMRLDFARFQDGCAPANVFRLLSHYGWHPGASAKRVFECLIAYKTGSPDTTFHDLETLRQQDPTRGFRELRVFATDLDTHLWIEFSDRKPATRDVRLADAVRMSMSFPFIFAAQRFGDDVIVDGGLVISYPLAAFDDGSPPTDTLGFHLGAGTARKEFKGLTAFTGAVIQTVVNRDNEVLCATPAEVRRSVFIDTLNVGSFDFALTAEQKCALVRSGASATATYLAETTHPSKCPAWLIRQPHLGKAPTPAS